MSRDRAMEMAVERHELEKENSALRRESIQLFSKKNKRLGAEHDGYWSAFIWSSLYTFTTLSIIGFVFFIVWGLSLFNEVDEQVKPHAYELIQEHHKEMGYFDENINPDLDF